MKSRTILTNGCLVLKVDLCWKKCGLFYVVKGNYNFRITTRKWGSSDTLWCEDQRILEVHIPTVIKKEPKDKFK